MFGRKKELARLRRSVEINEKRLNDWDQRLDGWEDFSRWAEKHAPATLRRFEEATGFGLPLIRPTQMEQINRILKDAYMPQLRSMLLDSRPLFEQLSQPQDQPITFDVEL